MKTTIETINNQLCTVVRKPFDAEKIKNRLALGYSLPVEFPNGYRAILHNSYKDGTWQTEQGKWSGENMSETVSLEILPALKRNPKDVELLHLYASYKLYAVIKVEIEHIEPVYKEFGDITPKKPDIRSIIHDTFIFGEDWANLKEGMLGTIISSTITHAIDDRTGERVEIALEG